jgi:hypothetical protein
MENPYAAPQAEIAEDAGRHPVYSPGQVMAGTFVGGPVGLIYFLRSNFVTLGNDALAKKSVVYGAVFIVALLVILPLLPESFPGLPLTIAYMVFGQQIANKYQLTRKAIDESTHYTTQSNGRVLGYSLLCLLASVIVLVVPLMLLNMLGARVG